MKHKKRTNFKDNKTIVFFIATIVCLIAFSWLVFSNFNANAMPFEDSASQQAKVDQSTEKKSSDSYINNVQKAKDNKEVSAEMVCTLYDQSDIKVGEFETLQDAFNQALKDYKVEITKEGIYKLPNILYNFTIKKSSNINVTIDATEGGAICKIPYGCTFLDLTFNLGGTSYHGFQEAQNIVMKNCVLNGFFNSYCDMVFDQCTFNQPNEEYAMWAYAGNLTYNNCVFNCNGKFINVYNEGLPVYTVQINGCTFNSTGKANKSALNVKGMSVNGQHLRYNVEIGKGNTTTGAFPTDKRLGSPLVMIDDGNSTDISIAFVDEKGKTSTVYPPEPQYVEIDISPEKKLSLKSALVTKDGLADLHWGSVDSTICTVTDDGVINKLKPGFCRVYVEDWKCRDEDNYPIRHEFNLDFPHLWFQLNGHGEGTIPPNQWATPYDGEEQIEPPTPHANGYIFEGWFTDEALTQPFDATQPVTEDKNLYAKWVAGSYDVIFHANNGTDASAVQHFLYDMPQQLKANEFTREGYFFSGWANEASGEVAYKDKQEVLNLWKGEGEPVVNLYAKWLSLDTPLKIELDGCGATTPGTQMIYAKFEDSYYSDVTCKDAISKIDQLPQREGYIFKGYWTDPDAANPQRQMLADENGELETTVKIFTLANNKAYASWEKIYTPEPGGSDESIGGTAKTGDDAWKALLCGIFAVACVFAVVIICQNRTCAARHVINAKHIK